MTRSKIKRKLEGQPSGQTRKTIKNKVRLYRNKKGLSQTDLARLVGVSRNSISSIERSEYVPTLKTAFKLSKILKVSITDIFSFED